MAFFMFSCLQLLIVTVAAMEECQLLCLLTTNFMVQASVELSIFYYLTLAVAAKARIRAV